MYDDRAHVVVEDAVKAHRLGPKRIADEAEVGAPVVAQAEAGLHERRGGRASVSGRRSTRRVLGDRVLVTKSAVGHTAKAIAVSSLCSMVVHS